MPVNNRIMNKDSDINSDQMTKDLCNWGRLHFPRTVLATIIFVLFADLTVQGSSLFRCSKSSKDAKPVR